MSNRLTWMIAAACVMMMPLACGDDDDDGDGKSGSGGRAGSAGKAGSGGTGGRAGSGGTMSGGTGGTGTAGTTAGGSGGMGGMDEPMTLEEACTAWCEALDAGCDDDDPIPIQDCAVGCAFAPPDPPFNGSWLACEDELARLNECLAEGGFSCEPGGEGGAGGAAPGEPVPNAECAVEAVTFFECDPLEGQAGATNQ